MGGAIGVVGGNVPRGTLANDVMARRVAFALPCASMLGVFEWQQRVR